MVYNAIDHTIENRVLKTTDNGLNQDRSTFRHLEIL